MSRFETQRGDDNIAVAASFFAAYRQGNG